MFAGGRQTKSLSMSATGMRAAPARARIFVLCGSLLTGVVSALVRRGLSKEKGARLPAPPSVKRSFFGLRGAGNASRGGAVAGLDRRYDRRRVRDDAGAGITADVREDVARGLRVSTQ